ncbi:hypothetical protein JQ609_24190 [Bradyrhizobium sp. AUGA SZCCT0169]|uniref:hypothetical protein n=1 Tax=Bradyrhizobium sp. AUGA SZCCT0169 TaxID=2807663 RepID=UPI001BACE150|nr:hypothetical protein [Bradyrhizobium sp. AUGA SZCCT0169]MBR1250012.1 hypothetical protein [Bradyrhizobium sp. AUGA SZCCT0169]
MTANAINAKNEALKLHELSSEELDAVSGGSKMKQQENHEQMQALKTFRAVLDAAKGL